MKESQLLSEKASELKKIKEWKSNGGNTKENLILAEEELRSRKRFV
jgi:hypothetical protein